MPPAGRSSSKDGAGPAERQEGDAPNPFAYLNYVDPKEKYRKAVKKEAKARQRLEQLMGQPLRPDCLGLEAMRQRHRIQVPPLASPSSAGQASGSPASLKQRPTPSAAPKYVGVNATEYAKAMAVENIHRFREESSAGLTSVRKLLTLDDSIEVAMACRQQETPHILVNVALKEPFLGQGPEAAKAMVLSKLDEDLHSYVRQCRVFGGGRTIEVFVETHSREAERVPEALEALGKVDRKATVDKTALIALRFDSSAGFKARRSVRQVKERPPHLWETKDHAAMYSPTESGYYSGTRSSPGLRFRDDESPEDGEDMSQQPSESLDDLIARWDSKLHASRYYQEAQEGLRRGGFRSLDL